MDEIGTHQRIDDLEHRLLQLEQVLRDVKDRQDATPALPSTSLLSGSFLTRAFAVLGHNFVASLIIVVPIYLLIFVFFIVIGFSLLG